MEDKTNQAVNPSTTPAQIPNPEHPVNNQRRNLPIILGVLVLLLVVGGGAYYFGTQKSTQSIKALQQITPTPQPAEQSITNTPIPTNTSTEMTDWKTYTDPNKYFSFQYPSNWTLKNGLDFKTDIAVYDPTMMKKWSTNGNGTISWPEHFFDILSVEMTAKTAKQEADDYEKSWNVTSAQLNRASFSKDGINFEFYDLEGENAVRYRNVGISNGKYLIKASSSINKIGDGTIESQILSTIKFAN